MSGPRQSDVKRADIGLRSERGPVLGAVMLSTGLVALDATILATAVPAVVDDLGGFAQFPWLFSIYLLAQAVTVPLYSKLADVFGRKPVMLAGIATFVVGSLLCGLAWSMGSLIAARLLQGIGAGAVQPIGMTIVGDIYSVAERAKVQGYIASVWAVSSLVGPALGGLFSDYLSWRWIFLINLPLGLAAYVMLQRGFSEQVERRRQSIDGLGALLLTGGCGLLLLGVLEGGVRWEWASGPSVAILGTAVLLLGAFVLAERRATDPVVPGWILRHRTAAAATAAGFVVGVLTLGLSSYVPVYGQQVLGSSAVAAGAALAAMSIGWPIAASNAGRLYLRFGFRATMVLGAAVTVAGGALLLTVTADSSIYYLAVPCFVMGLGFGLVVSPSVIAAQAAVDWGERGVVTGMTMFGRSVGSAVGVAVFGAVANGLIARDAGGVVPELADLPAGVLDPAVRAVFALAAALTLVLVAAVLVMPGRRGAAADDRTSGPPAAGPGTGSGTSDD
ncbi:MDR family MFS transporter [Nocardioides alkalitolerans]|uniref:MDR family MFS transporter n=1 Tax=Nocardioides alkalitolerans TaxID=281714 RepID=UPI0004078D40|nr:MDR family MFS transporter [Nocardioides alkalitolerans]